MGVKGEWIGARNDKGLHGARAQKIIMHTHWRGVWRGMAPNALGGNLLSKTVIPYIGEERFRFPAKREFRTANSLFEKLNSSAFLFQHGFELDAGFTAAERQGLSWTSQGVSEHNAFMLNIVQVEREPAGGGGRAMHQPGIANANGGNSQGGDQLSDPGAGPVIRLAFPSRQGLAALRVMRKGLPDTVEIWVGGSMSPSLVRQELPGVFWTPELPETAG